MPEAPFTLNNRGPILEITLSKGKANVISAADSRELNEMWEAFRDNPEQRFAILTGKGEKFFCFLIYESWLQWLQWVLMCYNRLIPTVLDDIFVTNLGYNVVTVVTIQ